MKLKHLHPALGRAYMSCIDSYNAGLWTPCAASCRRTLEGLVSNLLGEHGAKLSLYQQLKMLPEKVDLSKPLLAIVENLRRGGNVAAHFNLEAEPDEPVARTMVDLLDYFMEYVFVLNDRAAELETRLEALGEFEKAKQEEADPDGSRG